MFSEKTCDRSSRTHRTHKDIKNRIRLIRRYLKGDKEELKSRRLLFLSTIFVIDFFVVFYLYYCTMPGLSYNYSNDIGSFFSCAVVFVLFPIISFILYKVIVEVRFCRKTRKRKQIVRHLTYYARQFANSRDIDKYMAHLDMLIIRSKEKNGFAGKALSFEEQARLETLLWLFSPNGIPGDNFVESHFRDM